jgi:hypothetical protein
MARNAPVVEQGPTASPVPRGAPNPLAALPDWWALLAGGPGSSSGSYGSNRDPITNAIAPEALLPVCFGQVRVGGTVVYMQGTGSSYTFGQGVIGWCEGEIESIDAIMAGSGGFSARSDDWVTIAVNQHHGEPGGDTNPGNIFGSIKPSFAGCAYTHFQITVPSYLYRWWWTYVPGGYSNPNNSSGGIDAVPWAADVHGLKLYDPRLDSTNGGSGSHRYSDPTTWTYSNNPILICRYILVKYGHLVNGVDIDDPNIAAMAAASDTAGFTCNVVFAAKTLVRDALAVVLQTCNGSPIDVNGKAGFYLDIPNPGASAGTFDEAAGDIWGLKYEWLSARDRYTQYAVSFANASANYKADQTPIFGDPGTFSSEPTVAISSVNTGTNALTMASSPGWSVNDEVLFYQNGGVAVPGVSDGTTYFVKTISGADVTLALVASGTVIDLTGSPVLTTQYLQRVGAAYPPTMVVKLLVVNAPGINTLPAAIILRDFLYNAAAITFRVSGTMNARGINLQQGQKIHLTTLKGVDMDALIVQISGDQSGFFSFVVKPYFADVYGSTPITQGPPIVTPTRPNDINITDRTQTLQILTSTDSTHDNYDVFQLIEYVLPLNYVATIDHLAVRGSEAAGAQSQVWSDLAASEISVSTAGNATATDSTHENLYHTGVRRATRAITYSTRPTVLTDVTTEKTTRIIVQSVSADGSASNGVTVDYTAGVGPSGPPTAPPPASITSPFVIPPGGTATGQGGELQMKELVAGGTNVTGFGAPDALAADLRYVLPATGPATDGQALVYDAAGAYAGRKALKFALPYVEKLMIETPSGAMDGVNRTFVISQLPMTAKILLLSDARGGGALMPLVGGVDYGRDAQTIHLAIAANKPQSSMVAVYSYRAQVGSAVSSSETVPLYLTANTWSAETIGSKGWWDVAFSPTLGTGQGMLAAVSGDGTTTDIATSVNGGVTWVPQTTPATGGYRTIIWGNNEFLATNHVNYNKTMKSSDGVTWVEHTTTGVSYLMGGPVVWTGSSYVMGRGANLGDGPFFTSPNGVAWVDLGNGGATGTTELAALCWWPDLSLLVGVRTSDVVLSSDGGVTWAHAATSFTGVPKSVTGSPLGLLVAAGNFGIATSPTGAVWTTQTTPPIGTYGLGPVVWSEARQLLVVLKQGADDGETGHKAVLTSPDGLAWASHTTPAFAGLGLVCANEIDTLVAVGGSVTMRCLS